MVTVSKKYEISLALIVVVLATAMIAGTFTTFDNSVFARKITQISQSINETCDQDLSAPVQTSGGLSPITTSGIPIGACLNVNLGGNGVQLDQSNNVDNSQSKSNQDQNNKVDSTH
jgi:hypothetical protein